MKTTKPTKYELEFFNRAVDRMLSFKLPTMNRNRHILSTYEQFFGQNTRYLKLEKLFNERVNYLTPHPDIKRVKELTQEEWESKMNDSILDQLEWEDLTKLHK
jgi:hypothetical protein